MYEVWQVSVTGINVIPTLLLGLITLYWLSTIIGVLDLSFLDVDIDMDVDLEIDTDVDASGVVQGQGLFYSVLAFMNVDCIPLMIIVSVVFMFLWAFTIMASLLPIPTGGFITAGLLIPGFFLSMFCTKIVTIPLKPVFKKLSKHNIDNTKVAGRICLLKNDLIPGKLGQGEIKMADRELVINVKISDDLPFEKGDKAFVIGKDDEKDFYYIEHFDL